MKMDCFVAKPPRSDGWVERNVIARGCAFNSPEAIQERRSSAFKRGAVLATQVALIVVFVSIQASAQRSPFNNLEVLPADSTGHYRILIGGHFHGESTNRSGYPAATLLANLDTINSLGANLFLSTGDLFMDPVNDMPRYERSLFSKLKMPLFNAPGNHDLTDGYADTLRANHGDTESWFAIRASDPRFPELFTIHCWSRSLTDAEQHFLATQPRDEIAMLDTERDDGSLDAAALMALEGLADRADSGYVNQVILVSHRPIWAEDDPRYSPFFKDNTRSLTGTNFQKDVYPLLEKIAEHAHVYWISGSLGGSAPSSIFFQEHAKNITYIQCAIRDEPRDALLIADVYPDTVQWSSFSLTGQKLLAPEVYNAAWWREHIGKKEGFNWRLLPYLVKTTVFRKEFWWGAVAGALLLLLLRRFYRR
jgi:Calcineurin-like phosphoesterase